MLVIQCDECSQKLYEWKSGREIQQRAVTDLFREHLCEKCLTLEAQINAEMTDWDKKYMEKYNAEREKRVAELKNKHKQP